ncbi:hypothetical protein ArV1_096 [Arthrobacter phage vB_ArtM-ArV1]|uniref:Uncharacterized protein n=1 Tax=Arthrobacter phage vB_ArtM-ArV1 TaxID=1566993 RepID=A0A0A7HB11_9CAUD|nr:hypothetical protein ArV1_096 [Arthrobacter phage vB_ArtM-ArV1]AIZ01783.1 hypothetical protein ArV1_096 [Arthrobacter phage vB_ArtM-ArV1]
MPQNWSPETLKLRAEAGQAIDKLARSMHNDRREWGYQDSWTDEQREKAKLDNQQPTAWVAMVQYQGFTDPEESVQVHATSGATPATIRGLAEHLTEIY